MSKIRKIITAKRMFATGSSHSGDTILTSSFNHMSNSFARNEYLDPEGFNYGPVGALVYQINELRDDLSDIHTQVSASQYAPLDNSELQATSGSFNLMDAPGSIVGYTVNGLNVTHADYDLTTSMAVPDSNMNVTFRAPLSGIVEIEVQIRADGGSSGIGDLVFGLSDNSSYNAVQTYYEQGVLGFPRFDHMNVIHKWVVSGLTAGNVYQYWFGAKTTNTSGTPQLQWGGSSTGRFSDFIMKVTALPSNTYIET
jgi:hypothetical protein